MYAKIYRVNSGYVYFRELDSGAELAGKITGRNMAQVQRATAAGQNITLIFYTKLKGPRTPRRPGIILCKKV